MQRLGIYAKLQTHFNTDGWWAIANNLSANNKKFKIMYSVIGDYELFKEYPNGKLLEKTYGNGCLYIEGFEFDTEQDKLAFLLKWS